VEVFAAVFKLKDSSRLFVGNLSVEEFRKSVNKSSIMFSRRGVFM